MDKTKDNELFVVKLSFQGKVIPLESIRSDTSGEELYAQSFEALGLSRETFGLKLLWKGKKISQGSESVFGNKIPKTPPKILAMGTSIVRVETVNSKRSDPTIRGFDAEKSPNQQKKDTQWGFLSMGQHRDYKFCRFQACTWQSFGHRPSESTPHAFRALELLEQLATDPGVKAIMEERQLVVNTLGEMDPIDDRLMQEKERTGSCLLGYNTNAGLRIDVKLRTDDLLGFRPYPELVSTLIHELSHNWVSDHNWLFWTNFGQMRVEYFMTHARLRHSLVNGKTTADIAGLPPRAMTHVYDVVMQELTMEMAQHRLHPNAIASAIQQRCQELESTKGNRLGTTSSNENTNPTPNNTNEPTSARELALAAAERRAKQQNDTRENK